MPEHHDRRPGYRAWALRSRSYAQPLVAPHHLIPVPAGGTFTARCKDHPHPAPDPSCFCGITWTAKIQRIAAYIDVVGDIADNAGLRAQAGATWSERIVIGRLDASGPHYDCVEHRFERSARATIRTLYVPHNLSDDAAALPALFPDVEVIVSDRHSGLDWLDEIAPDYPAYLDRCISCGSWNADGGLCRICEDVSLNDARQFARQTSPDGAVWLRRHS